MKPGEMRQSPPTDAILIELDCEPLRPELPWRRAIDDVMLALAAVQRSEVYRSLLECRPRMTGQEFSEAVLDLIRRVDCD